MKTSPILRARPDDTTVDGWNEQIIAVRRAIAELDTELRDETTGSPVSMSIHARRVVLVARLAELRTKRDRVEARTA